MNRKGRLICMRSSLALRLTIGLLTTAALLTPMRLARADGGGGDMHQVVDGYRVELVFEADLKLGVVPVRVQLLNAEGQPVPDARVQVVQNLISTAETGGHGATEANTHSEVEEDTHGEAESGHGSADERTEAESAHDESETTQAHTDSDGQAGADVPADLGADPHDEAAPHTHDDSSLFQLAWNDEAGAYTSSVIFFQPGQWAVHVEFTVDGQEHVAEFGVEVSPPDPGPTVLAAFAGLNALVLGTAIVLKRKSTAA
jgi:hypothetical protein